MDELFSCRLENSKKLAELCECLCESKREVYCDIECTPASLVLAVSNSSKSAEARVSLPSGQFDLYSVSSESIRFCINLSHVLDCLLLCGNSSDDTSITMFYSNVEESFRITLENSGVLTVCEIGVLNFGVQDEIQGFHLFRVYSSAPENAQFIMKSSLLKEIFEDLIDCGGPKGTIMLEILTHPELLIWSTSSPCGGSSCEIKLPRDSKLHVSFKAEESSRWSYPSHLISMGMRALAFANETVIRQNSDGIFCIQHQIPNSAGADIYFDCVVMPVDVSV